MVLGSPCIAWDAVNKRNESDFVEMSAALVVLTVICASTHDPVRNSKYDARDQGKRYANVEDPSKLELLEWREESEMGCEEELVERTGEYGLE